MQIRKQSLDNFAVFLVVLASGNPVVPHLLGKEAVWIALPVVLGTYGLLRGIRLKKSDAWLFAVFVLIALAHYGEFGPSVLPASVGFLLKLLAAIFLVRIVHDFPQAYGRVMWVLALISLAIFVPQIVLGDVLRSFAQVAAISYGPDVTHVGFHNFGPEMHAYRNSGFFWEPGAFAGYLTLAILLLIAQKAGRTKTLRFIDKQVAVLVLAVLTTQSTTGYVALAGLAVAFLWVNYGVRQIGRFLVAICLVIFGALLAYTEVPFLGEKIDAQYGRSLAREGAHETTRFGNAIYDFSFIRERPVLGWSTFTETRSRVDQDISEIAAGQGNGLTGLIVKFGFVGLVIFVALSFRFFMQHSGSRILAGAAVAVVLVLLVGEQYLNYPLFLTLMCAGGVASSRQIEAAEKRSYRTSAQIAGHD